MTNVSATEIRRAAMNLLARREYCVQELVAKLTCRYPSCSYIHEQVYQLTAENLQSDRRYVESFINLRIQKGQGPLRIINELLQKGVDQVLISQVFQTWEVDWQIALGALNQRKYGNTTPIDEKDRAKRIRFFQYRGFSLEQIQHLSLAMR